MYCLRWNPKVMEKSRGYSYNLRYGILQDDDSFTWTLHKNEASKLSLTEAESWLIQFDHPDIVMEKI